MSVEQKIETIIKEPLEDMGLRVVRVRLSGNTRLVLQIMLDRLDKYPISVDECSEASILISALLDVDDPIEKAYQLEVSSPGIDRPLTSLQDFDDWQGFQAKISLRHKLDGRRRFQGELGATKNDYITISDSQYDYEIPFSLIESAKLVLDDKLMEFSQKQAKILGLGDLYEGS